MINYLDLIMRIQYADKTQKNLLIIISVWNNVLSNISANSSQLWISMIHVTVISLQRAHVGLNLLCTDSPVCSAIKARPRFVWMQNGTCLNKIWIFLVMDIFFLHSSSSDMNFSDMIIGIFQLSMEGTNESPSWLEKHSSTTPLKSLRHSVIGRKE